MSPKSWGKLAILAVVMVAIVSVIAFKKTGTPSATPIISETTAEEHGATGVPRLLELGSNECRPCQMMQPILADLRKEYPGKLQVDYIDIWKDGSLRKTQSLLQQYGVKAIPAQIFFDAKGTVVFRHVGFYPKDDILAKFKELGISQ